MHPERNVNVWVKFHGNPSKHFWNFILWNKEMNCRPQDTGSWLIAGFPYWTRYKYHNNDLKKKKLAHFCGYVFVRPTTIPDFQQRNTECFVLCPVTFAESLHSHLAPDILSERNIFFYELLFLKPFKLRQEPVWICSVLQRAVSSRRALRETDTSPLKSRGRGGLPCNMTLHAVPLFKYAKSSSLMEA